MQKWQYIHNQQLGDSRTRRRIVYQTRFIPRPEKCKSFILNATALKSFAAGSFIEVAPWISFTARGSISNMKTAFAAKIPPPSLGQGNFRLLLAPLLPVHFLNLLFHNTNGLVKPVRVLTHPLDLDSRKPLAGVLRGLAQRLEMPGPHQKRQVIIRPAENCGRDLHADARRPIALNLVVRSHISVCSIKNLC